MSLPGAVPPSPSNSPPSPQAHLHKYSHESASCAHQRAELAGERTREFGLSASVNNGRDQRRRKKKGARAAERQQEMRQPHLDEKWLDESLQITEGPQLVWRRLKKQTLNKPEISKQFSSEERHRGLLVTSTLLLQSVCHQRRDSHV